MSKSEQKEIKLEVELPAEAFPKVMYFNRFHLEREDAFYLVQFGLLSSSGLVDSYSCVFPRTMMRENQDTLLDYLKRIGSPGNTVPPWKGTSVEKSTELADVIAMAFRGEMAETCLYFFSLTGATRVRKAGSVEPIRAQPLILLRSTTDVQKQFITSLYEE